MNTFQVSGFKAAVREPIEPNMKQYQKYANKNIRTFKILKFYVHIIKSNNF